MPSRLRGVKHEGSRCTRGRVSEPQAGVGRSKRSHPARIAARRRSRRPSRPGPHPTPPTPVGREDRPWENSAGRRFPGGRPATPDGGGGGSRTPVRSDRTSRFSTLSPDFFSRRRASGSERPGAATNLKRLGPRLQVAGFGPSLAFSTGRRSAPGWLPVPRHGELGRESEFAVVGSFSLPSFLRVKRHARRAPRSRDAPSKPGRPRDRVHSTGGVKGAGGSSGRGRERIRPGRRGG